MCLYGTVTWRGDTVVYNLRNKNDCVRGVQVNRGRWHRPRGCYGTDGSPLGPLSLDGRDSQGNITVGDVSPGARVLGNARNSTSRKEDFTTCKKRSRARAQGSKFEAQSELPSAPVKGGIAEDAVLKKKRALTRTGRLGEHLH